VSRVVLRNATAEDALFLAELWQEFLRHTDLEEQVADVRAIVAAATVAHDQRLLVAEYDGVAAGAVLARATTFSPINLEPTLQVFSPVVLAPFRRRGVGHALMDATVAFAEELGIGHVAMPASSGSRDANRFLARLALTPMATWRVAATAAVRGKLTAQLPPAQRVRERRTQLGQVLAARRSMRRQQTQPG